MPQTEEVEGNHYTIVGLCHMFADIVAAISISRSSILASGALRGLI